jgi:hypothetical protein
MKKLGLFLICVSLSGFMLGCSSETQTKTQEAGQAVEDAAGSAVDDVEDAASDAVDAADEAVDDAVDAVDDALDN